MYILKIRYNVSSLLHSNLRRRRESRGAFKILTGTPTGKRPLGRPRLSWDDNIRIDLKEELYEELG